MSISVFRIRRISLSQYDTLLSGLLSVPNGGLFPVLFAAATFNTVKEFFGLDWRVEWKTADAANAASGAGADITILAGDEVVLAVQVTETTVNRPRVASTFDAKIGPAMITDCLFLVGSAGLTVEAQVQAHRYFAQGHEVNFVNIKDWILMSLATMGTRGRELFNANITHLLEDDRLPQPVRVSWNDQIAALLQV